jgi:hypothetical protein
MVITFEQLEVDASSSIYGTKEFIIEIRNFIYIWKIRENFELSKRKLIKEIAVICRGGL